MKDPISAGGTAAIRYAVSTTPVMLTMPVALMAPVCVWAGKPDWGVQWGFTVAVLSGFGMEYVRRASIYPHRPATRAWFLALLASVFRITPILCVTALVLGLIAVSVGGQPSYSSWDDAVEVLGLVFAIIASLGSIGLVSMMRSPIWEQHVAASREGQ